MRVFTPTLVRFFVSGGSAAALFFVLYYAGMKGGLPAFMAYCGAYAIAFVVSYIMQQVWTFGAHHRHSVALPRYAFVQVCCAIFTGLVTQAVAVVLPHSPLLVSLMATGLASGVSYIASLLWVFPQARSGAAAKGC
jgi:putative flippase GtrA